jgi:hypothetical protein
MDARILGVMAVPAFLVGPGRAEFDHPLTARGVPAPAGRPRLGEPPRAGQVLDHERDLLVVYVPGAVGRATESGVLGEIFRATVS